MRKRSLRPLSNPSEQSVGRRGARAARRTSRARRRRARRGRGRRPRARCGARRKTRTWAPKHRRAAAFEDRERSRFCFSETASRFVGRCSGRCDEFEKPPGRDRARRDGPPFSKRVENARFSRRREPADAVVHSERADRQIRRIGSLAPRHARDDLSESSGAVAIHSTRRWAPPSAKTSRTTRSAEGASSPPPPPPPPPYANAHSENTAPRRQAGSAPAGASKGLVSSQGADVATSRKPHVAAVASERYAPAARAKETQTPFFARGRYPPRRVTVSRVSKNARERDGAPRDRPEGHAEFEKRPRSFEPPVREARGTPRATRCRATTRPAGTRRRRRTRTRSASQKSRSRSPSRELLFASSYSTLSSRRRRRPRRQRTRLRTANRGEPACVTTSRSSGEARQARGSTGVTIRGSRGNRARADAPTRRGRRSTSARRRFRENVAFVFASPSPKTPSRSREILTARRSSRTAPTPTSPTTYPSKHATQTTNTCAAADRETYGPSPKCSSRGNATDAAERRAKTFFWFGPAGPAGN